jgi:E3 ubiquitin-protein ligase HUWE1
MLLCDAWLWLSISIQRTRRINLKIDGDGLDGDIQAAAFYALEGIFRYLGKIAEVAGAVGVFVGLGALMRVVRKMAKELEREQAACQDDFIGSLLYFLRCLQLSLSAGSLLVGAGIVPVLVDICKNWHPDLIETVVRAFTNMQLSQPLLTIVGCSMDLLWAFALFNHTDGLKVFVNRIIEAVDKANAAHHVDITSSFKPSELLVGMLSHSSAGLLKPHFCLIQRLLISTGLFSQLVTKTSVVFSHPLIRNR